MRIILKMTSPTLQALRPLQEARVLGFAGELREDFRHRLRELGFREGALVRCVRRTPFGGPGVFEVSGAIFSLGAEIATQVQVSEVGSA